MTPFWFILGCILSLNLNVVKKNVLGGDVRYAHMCSSGTRARGLEVVAGVGFVYL